jgi:hypothetical protein
MICQPVGDRSEAFWWARQFGEGRFGGDAEQAGGPIVSGGCSRARNAAGGRRSQLLPFFSGQLGRTSASEHRRTVSIRTDGRRELMQLSREDVHVGCQLRAGRFHPGTGREQCNAARWKVIRVKTDQVVALADPCEFSSRR